MTTTTMRAAAGELRGGQATCDLEHIGGENNFLHRLMAQMAWNRDYARRAIAEYVRFCELSGRCDHPVTPSAEVDQVWHLHLLDSRDYWQRWCPQVLGRELHHTPSRRGHHEARRYHEQYALTLRSYERRYGEPPPPDIWPAPARRFAHRERVIDSARCWVIPKPRLPNWIALLGLLGVALLLSESAPAASRHAGEGGQVWVWAFVAFAVAGLWRLCCREAGIARPPLPDAPAELAFAASGEQRATDVTVVRLLAAGQIEIDGHLLRRSNAGERPVADDLLGRAVWSALAQPQRPSTVARELRRVWQQWVLDMQQAGLWCSAEHERRQLYCWLVLPVAAWLAWPTLVKEWQRDVLSVVVPVLLLTGLLTVMLRKRLRATWNTRKAITELKNQHQRLQTAACRDEWTLAVALFGVKALAATELVTYLELRKQRGDSYDAEAGCSDAASAGGGCGGDGGCGGCGGCG